MDSQLKVSPEEFAIAKSNLVKALQIVAATLKDDVYGELKKVQKRSEISNSF